MGLGALRAVDADVEVEATLWADVETGAEVETEVPVAPDVEVMDVVEGAGALSKTCPSFTRKSIT